MQIVLSSSLSASAAVVPFPREAASADPGSNSSWPTPVSADVNSTWPTPVNVDSSSSSSSRSAQDVGCNGRPPPRLLPLRPRLRPQLQQGDRGQGRGQGLSLLLQLWRPLLQQQQGLAAAAGPPVAVPVRQPAQLRHRPQRTGQESVLLLPDQRGAGANVLHVSSRLRNGMYFINLN